MVSPSALEADLCVVGAGIVGLAHALEARRRDLQVVVLERSERAIGASVRNFGHCFISAMGDGDALECALRGRARWLELGARAGIDVLENGSLLVARHEDELEVMTGLAGDPRRRARIVTASEAGELAPIPIDELIGALHCQLDLRVDPRTAVARLAALLEQDPGAQVQWGAPVHAIEPGAVHARGLTVRAPHTFVCPGPDYATLPPELRPRRTGLTLCKLQMLRVRPPGSRRYRPALLTGLSLLRYPGFATRPARDRVQARYRSERPELLAAGIHLIVTQLPGGDLILGDTHAYGETVTPFSDERLDALVLDEAARLLGAVGLEVRERWHGVYPIAPGEPFMITAPMPGVRVVEVVCGAGMTTALGLAPRALDELTGAVSVPPEGPPPGLPEAPRPSAVVPAGYGS